MFPSSAMDVLHSVDFDVMILLSSIMVINHLVVHLKETREVIEYLQKLIRDDPVRGLWLISFAAFIASPFLTNDGVCLLFVEPILSAFDSAPFAAELVDAPPDLSGRLQIRKEDVMYFLLALACSSNIGSALTYTGNPQNMIVASDSLEVLPSYKFFIYMLPASLFSWFASKLWRGTVAARSLV
jgi:Na+/H+ antiporter NhaD/arsenite permease-like protein